MIDAGGPRDAAVAPQRVSEVARAAWFTLMAPGWQPPETLVTQAYGFCLTGDAQVVLVTRDGDSWNLPGGQVEAGERPVDALVREVAEEACARVVRARYLACQHVWDPHAPAGPTSHYQTRWWARVELDPWDPHHEIVARRLVPPEDVVATLFWRDKLIPSRLLEQALLADRADRA